MNDGRKIVPTHARQDNLCFRDGKRNFVKKQTWWEKHSGQESPQVPGTGNGELGL
jgi:hypothetical protein